MSIGALKLELQNCKEQQHALSVPCMFCIFDLNIEDRNSLSMKEQACIPAQGRTALMTAAARGHVAVVRALLGANAAVDARDTKACSIWLRISALP